MSERLADLRIGGQLVIAMPISKKIIVDRNVENVIQQLKDLGATNVSGIDKLGLPPDASDNLIAKKLNELSTPNSAYLFITNNEKEFGKLGTKNYDILIVNKTNAETIEAIKTWLALFSKRAKGTLHRVIERLVNKTTHTYAFDVDYIKEFKNKKPAVTHEPNTRTQKIKAKP